MRFTKFSSEMKAQSRKVVLTLRFRTTEPNKESLTYASYRSIA